MILSPRFSTSDKHLDPIFTGWLSEVGGYFRRTSGYRQNRLSDCRKLVGIRGYFRQPS